MNAALEALKSDNFFAEVGFAGTPSILRRILQENDAVQAIKSGLSSFSLDEQEIRRFANQLMEDLQVGTRFSHEMAIAALAVALENRGTNFAMEFISDLASLNLAEMSYASRVARLSLAHQREHVAKTIRTATQIDLAEMEPRRVSYEALSEIYPKEQRTETREFEFVSWQCQN